MFSLILVSALLACQAGHDSGGSAEVKRIESLIGRVETLQDAKFIRNGVEYDAKTAGQFLRGKWNTQKAEIKTAKDFIEKVASKSSTTGKPYVIKHSDGREIESAEYLTAELKKLESVP